MLACVLASMSENKRNKYDVHSLEVKTRLRYRQAILQNIGKIQKYEYVVSFKNNIVRSPVTSLKRSPNSK